MKFQSIKTSRLSKEQINQIIKLKESYWKYGIKSQVNWFKKNVSCNDVHNLMIVNDKIKGYTFLANRSLEIIKTPKEIKKFDYILFLTLILDKEYRKFVNLSKLMKFNNNTIKKAKKLSFLLCKKNKIKMYKYFGWRKLVNDSFTVPDHKNKLIGFVFNFNTTKLCMNSKIRFFYK